MFPFQHQVKIYIVYAMVHIQVNLYNIHIEILILVMHSSLRDVSEAENHNTSNGHCMLLHVEANVQIC